LDIRPSERTLDLGGIFLFAGLGGLAVTPKHKELIIIAAVAVVAAIKAMTRDKPAAE